MNKGRIIKLVSGSYTIVDLETKEILNAKPRGVFRKNNLSPKVGDIVEYDQVAGTYIIEEIIDRFNDLIRPTIANIDQAFVLFSVKEPDLNLNLLDKFLTVLEFNQINPIIIFTKMDLLNNDEEIDKAIQYYREIGYKVYTTSTTEKEKDYQELKSIMKDKVSVFTGQSGVGKSSLLNLLSETLSLDTNEISQALGRGKHTTRHVELYPLFDGWIADTPGFGQLELKDYTDADVATNFIEFFKASSMCKYNGCLHLNEPGCEVKKRIKEGKIAPSRYENYLTFIQDLRKERAHDYRTINLKHPRPRKK